MRLTVFQKGLILTAIPLACQLVFIALLIGAMQDNSRAQAWALRSMEVRKQAQAILNGIGLEELRLSAYLLTGDVKQLPLEATRNDVPKALQMLLDLKEDHPGQHAQAVLICDNAIQFMQWLRINEELATAGHKNRVAANLNGKDGKTRLANVHSAMQAFLDEEDRLSRANAQALEQGQQRLFWILVAGSLAALVLTAGLAGYFSRGIASRLESLMQNARHLAAGHELTMVTPGTDEISALDQAFRTMAGQLQERADAIRRLNDELEQRVDRRTAELSDANRELAQKNQEVEMFVYSVSHDLRSPLVNLEGFSKELSLCGDELRRLLADPQVPESIRTSALKLFDEGMTESISFIQTAVRRLSKIIDALLRLSRAGRVEYQWQNVDLNSVLARVVASLRNSIAERGAHVKIGPLPTVRGDPTALEQVFANLLGNALHYLDPQRPGQIEVGMLDGPDQDGSTTCFVKDNGLGIAPAHQHKVFQAFQRLHPDRAQGEGMGLTIVRRIVERHRGRIWMESEPGQGSAFFVNLPKGNSSSPLTPSDPETTAGPPAPPSPAGETEATCPP